MAADVGATGSPIGRVLAERTPHFSFLQAMWLLHRALPGTVPLGFQGPPDEEPVRLRSSISLGFPPCDIESIEETTGGHPPYRLTTTFLGLCGAHSPLPSFYAEETLYRCEDGDDSVRGFLDIFNHRLLSLFYRGLLRYRGHLQYRDSGNDEFSWRLFALSGLADDETNDGTIGGLPRARLLRFTGLWCRQPRSAATVAAVLATYFGGLRVRIQQCVHRWVYLTGKTRCTLGKQFCRLGENATIGGRTADRMGKFRISIGPVNLETYRKFLPGGEELAIVSRLVRLASGGWMDFDIEVILRGEDTPRLGVKLSTEGELGRTAGLFSNATADLPVVFSGGATTG